MIDRVELKQAGLQPRACPVCGQAPRTIQTFGGDYLLLCFPHAETELAPNLDEAIRRWNAGKVLGQASALS